MCDQAKRGLQTISLMEMTNEGWRKIEQGSRIVLEDFEEEGVVADSRDPPTLLGAELTTLNLLLALWSWT